MKPRDILTLIGGCCATVGPVLMHHVPSSTAYTVGEILSALGTALLGYRAFQPSPADPSEPPAIKLNSPK